MPEICPILRVKTCTYCREWNNRLKENVLQNVTADLFWTRYFIIQHIKVTRWLAVYRISYTCIFQLVLISLILNKHKIYAFLQILLSKTEKCGDRDKLVPDLPFSLLQTLSLYFQPFLYNSNPFSTGHLSVLSTLSLYFRPFLRNFVHFTKPSFMAL